MWSQQEVSFIDQTTRLDQRPGVGVIGCACPQPNGRVRIETGFGSVVDGGMVAVQSPATPPSIYPTFLTLQRTTVADSACISGQKEISNDSSAISGN